MGGDIRLYIILVPKVIIVILQLEWDGIMEDISNRDCIYYLADTPLKASRGSFTTAFWEGITIPPREEKYHLLCEDGESPSKK